MKKFITIFSILFLMLLVFPISSMATNNNFSNLTMDIKITADGTAIVNEVWEVSIYDGTEMYKPYYNMQTSEIKNLSVKDENNTEYKFLSSWDINANLEGKKEKCGLNKASNGVEICWGIGEYGKHTYTISYEITNFVSDYGNYQLTYFTLVPSQMDPTPQNVEIRISSDANFTSSNVTATGSGFTGNTEIVDGVIKLKSSSALSSSQYVTVQIKFETGTFNTSDIINQENDNTAIDNNHVVNNNIPNNTNKTGWKKYIPYIILVVLIIIVIYFINKKRRDDITVM